MYRVPSGPSTGDEETSPPVKKLHFTLPAGELLLPTVSMAYTRRSSDPMYRVPSGPSTGDEETSPPVKKLHFTLPAGELLLNTVSMA
jgi:predicted metal-dependent hydrolase